jgi:putative transposase
MKQDRQERKYLRLKHYDYSQSGAYFVTICTNEREAYFAKCRNLEVVIQNHWKGLKIRFPEIELDEFIVMPNHIHGIIFIVGATHELPLQLSQKRRQNMLLSKVVGYFKMNTAKQINQILNRAGLPFWQRSYYEHVIRNEKELRKIREYILNNPLKWELDRENPISKNFNSDHDSYWKEIYCRDNS